MWYENIEKQWRERKTKLQKNAKKNNFHRMHVKKHKKFVGIPIYLQELIHWLLFTQSLPVVICVNENWKLVTDKVLKYIGKHE